MNDNPNSAWRPAELDAPTPTASKRRRPLSRILLTAVSAVAALVLAAGIGVAATPKAEAATQGVGWGNFATNNWLGSSIVNGSEYGYCIDIDGGGHQGTDVGPFALDGWKGMDANARARLNWVLTTYGSTSDPNLAAAVQLYVWLIADTAVYNAAGGFGWYSWRAPAAQRPAIEAAYNSLIAEGSAITAGGGSGTATLTLEVDHANNYEGTLAVSTSPANATGTLTLTNGIFVETGTDTYAIPSNANGRVLEVRGTPPNDDGEPYTISAHGEFSAFSGWSSTLRTWVPNPGGQRHATPNAGSAIQFSADTMDPFARGVQFLPAVTTQVTNKVVNPGETFSDDVTFVTVADDAGTNNDWFQSPVDGHFLRVYAKATIYGPFESQPEESTEVPADAPIAGTTSYVADGPGTYTVDSGVQATETGYYTWVWAIDWADQTVANGAEFATQIFVPGPSTVYPDQEPYEYADNFGRVAETSIVPSEITAVSQVTESEVTIGDAIQDTLTVSSSGVWLRNPADATQYLPVVFRGTAYFVPGDEAPEQSSVVPAEATVVGTTTIIATGPGEYVSDELIAPTVAGGGWVSWVWEIRPEDQDESVRGFAGAWSDDFGIPAETQRVLAPSVTTRAAAGAELGEEFTDTAIVTGPVPAAGAELSFELYEVPVADADDEGRFLPAYPADVEPGDFSWVCTPENLVFTTDPVAVAEAGEYESEGFTPEGYGRYVWIETLTTVTSDGETVVLARDECGLIEETTFVVDITTRAQTNDPDLTRPTLWDTASMVGHLPENGRVEFSAYRVDAADLPIVNGEVDYSEVCTVENLVFTSDPVELHEGGLFLAPQPFEVTGGGYVAEAWSVASSVYWVERTYDSAGRLVSEGECGDVRETTAVTAVAAAATDRVIGGAVVVGGSLAALTALVVIGLALVRRREAAE